MTSGNFTSVSIDSIIVHREDRQRRELTGIPELARSISTIGLINPIVVESGTMVLVAGERRLSAINSLGWSHIPVQWAEDLPPEELELIELEENIKRVALPWKDECAAVTRYHDMNLSRDPDWTGNLTAMALGIGDNEVSSRRAVQAALDAGEPLVMEADKYSVARGIVERKASRARDSETDEIGKLLGSPKTSPTAVERTDDQETHTTYVEELEISPAIPLLHSEFYEWASQYTGVPFNFIHCDFPYGINASEHHGGAADKFGGYDDREDVYWDLLNQLQNSMDIIVAPSAHMMFWFSMQTYTSTLVALEAMGWTVNKFPLIWFRSDNSGIMPDPQRGGRRTYETAFHCSRGDRKVVKPVSMLCPNPNTKEYHMSEKPRPMLRHFFRMYVDDSTRMLDPTCGSANAVIEALDAGANVACGIERDETFFEDACRNYLKWEQDDD